ncbi:hypothetical protein PRZ48_012948 [Zasmidium cellare]|uniref:Ketosynthase family 3 (KS3) domain-containing protein n=1 Tax=Zasmidium cellare TaxID=395010 RepID=A0ABR0E2Q1_ZASCE|nr:hypothetical protein PRZ48_012948 [Zasmidium cellare]
MEGENNGAAPIAICGIGLRLPGDISTTSALFDFLRDKKDARSLIPAGRYNAKAFHSEHGKPNSIKMQHGYFLSSDESPADRAIDLANFDCDAFSPTPAEAAHLDPQHRLALEVTKEALDSAGETGWRGAKIGTYVGVFAEDWRELQQKDELAYTPYRVLGAMDYALGNRLAYEFDLKGPSMTIKTACSSAGVALHEACQAIQQGSISSAVVCGANLMLAPGMTIDLSLQMAISADGSSKSFDASADGYARAEAVTAIYIKRLDQAVRDGNPVRAVIRGSASNADGKTNGMPLPSSQAHEACIQAAYMNAGLPMNSTTIAESHGTGTKVGDPLEAKAISKCFGHGDGVILGAVKPNLGHSEAAAALTSIVKAVISLERQTILPNIKFEDPNPASMRTNPSKNHLSDSD